MLVRSENPVFPAAFDPKVTFSFTALRDLAEAIATIFQEREKHYLAQYTACSTGPTSYAEVLAILSEEIGKPIQVQRLGYYEAGDKYCSALARNSGEFPRGSRDVVHRLLLYYNFYGIKGNTNVLEWLIGRKPTSIGEFLHQRVSEIRAST